MIRVLHFTDITNRHDFIDTIVQNADRNRFHMDVCALLGTTNIEDPIYSGTTRRHVLGNERRRDIPRAAWRLARLLRRWNIDVLHTHHYEPSIIGWLATRIYPKTRLVVGRHYSDAWYRIPSRTKRTILIKVEQLVNRAATRIVSPSNYIVDILTQRQGVRADKVDFVPYGFVPEKYDDIQIKDVRNVQAQLGLEKHFVVGNFSRLHEEKGLRFLLEAVVILRKNLPNLKVLLVGEGPERGNLEKQIKELEIADSVQLLGWRKDAMQIMSAVDIVVQPSLQEAFSQVMVEALWMNKPLVMTDVSGAPDIICDGKNGLLIPKGDPAAIVTAIQRLADDDQLRIKLETAGRIYVEEQLNISKIIPLYEQVYLKAMGKKI